MRIRVASPIAHRTLFAGVVGAVAVIPLVAQTARKPAAEAPTAAAAAVGAAGASCLSAADCGPDMVCEGQGCGEDQPGTCQPLLRPCTMDLRPYCGCDGQTFLASGSCPGARYAAAMPCPGTTP